MSRDTVDMKRHAPLFLTILLLTACNPVTGGGTYSSSSSSLPSADIDIDSPAANAVTNSPLTVTGKAKGTWYFEASFPVYLLDDRGKEIATTHADAHGDWMTENFVPFAATLTFTTNAPSGTLVLHNDNPSGLPENDKSVTIPVNFQ